ncbi:MAG: hypothetical protein KatS3mg116_0807 [Elioraea sp.]|nr:MAG: hypothetical protein KatS3mg116_0807 [Elioraea sp.]
MRTMTRRVLAWIAGLTILAAVAHGLAWWLIGAMVVRGIDAGGPAGETLRHAGLVRGGWPTRIAVTLERPVLHRPAVGIVPAMTIEAVRASATAPLLAPRDVTAAFACPCRVAFPATPALAPVTVEASRLVLELRLEDGAPPRTWSLTGEALAILRGGETVRIRAARLDGARGDRQEAAQVVALALDDILLGPGAGGPFGREIRSVTGEVAVRGTLPPAPDPEASLRAWREAGGALELRRLAVAWGPLALSAGATLALDDALQPEGTGTIRLADWRPTIEALSRAGLIDRRASALIGLAFAALARPAPGGGPPVVEVPVALADRTLAAARFPIARLPEIRWPRGAHPFGSR